MSIKPSATPPKIQEGKLKVSYGSKQYVGQSWKDIIFIPYNRLVMFTFMAATYMSVMYNVYLLTYLPKELPFLVRLIFEYGCEVVYFVCVVVIILHRLMKTHRQRMIYKPVPLFLIAVDFISILPLRILYATINRYTWKMYFSEYQLQFNQCYLKFARIIRIIFFYFDLRGNLTNNQTVIIIVCHLLGSFMVIFILASVYHYIGLTTPVNVASWTNHWVNANITLNNMSDTTWFIICIYEIAGLYYNNSLELIRYTNMNDTLLIFIAMLLGFISQYTFLLGTLTSEELQGMRGKYNLQIRLTAAKKLMTILMMPEQLQQTVQDYYETIWNYRLGVVTMPSIVDRLPPFMKSEILTDIYWEALLHTKIFDNVSNVFRKVIAEQMKTEIYMQGHLVFRDKDIKAKLVYLQSGMLEIYNVDADDSRITLSSGSVLCEVSCIQCMKSTANVKCLTNCTLHVLYMVDFYKALLKSYSHEFKTMRNTYHTRVNYCRSKLNYVGKQVRMSHMRWVKTQWRNLFESKESTCDKHFTSRFLDLIAIISTKVDPSAFCLRGKCPFVMMSGTALSAFFYYLCLCATLINFFFTFRDIFFEGRLELENYKYYVLIDSIFFLDIYLQSISTIKTFSHVIDQPYDILVYKLKNIFFLLDLVASIPLDYLGIIAKLPPKWLCVMRLNRFIRLYKTIQFFYYHEKRVTPYAGLLKFFKFVLYHVLLGLLSTSAVYLCNCFGDECQPTGFVAILKAKHLETMGYNIKISDFFICLYYTINIYMKLVLRVYSQFLLSDLVIKVVIIIISYYMLTIKLAQICALVGLRYERSHLLQERVDMIDIRVQENKELKKYKNRLVECLSAEWSISDDLRFHDLCSITHQESEFLRRNVNDEYILWILEQTDFFKPFPRDFRSHLAHHSQIFLIPEGHELIKFEYRCFYLYIVVQGFCVGKSYTAGDLEKNIDTWYKRLDVFPLLEYLHQVGSLMDVKSHTAVQVITIPYSVFQACISVYNREVMVLNAALKAHGRQFMGLLTGATASKTDEEEKRKLNKATMFQYTIRRQHLILDITNCSQQQSRDSAFLKYRKILKQIAYSTYSPNSNYYIAYEIFRCLCILLDVNIIFFLCVAEVYKNSWALSITYVMYFLWFCDMIIQAHLEYYNSYGILVQDLKATSMYYLRHSFLLEFIGGMPYDLFNLIAFVRPARRLSVEIMILMTARLILLLRPIQFSVYLQGDGVTRTQRFLKYITIVLMIYHFIMFLAAMKLLITCDIDEDRHYLCPETCWIMVRQLFLDWDESKFFWISFRSILVTGVSIAGPLSLESDHVLTLVIGVIVILVRIALLSKITGDNCNRQFALVEHQDAMKRYNVFFRDRLVSNNTKSEMLNHYKNIWQKSYSDKSRKIFDNIYPFLRETLLLTMYKTAVAKCILFKDQNVVLFKLFIPHLEERYYVKNAPIIRTNDVQGNIFIVVKGQVEVTMASCRLAHLGPGGLFGCFEPLGLNRHTMAFKAVRHTNVLVIKAPLFYQLIKGYSKTESLMRRMRETQFQYATMGVRKFDIHDSMASAESGHTSLKAERLQTLYRLFLYVTNVHIAPISAYCVLVNSQVEIGVMQFLPLWIVLDLYFSLCFIIRGRQIKIDHKTGVIINRPRELQFQYLKSFLFCADILTILPVYLIRIWWFSNWHQLVFLSNKLFRLYFLYHQYQKYVLAKNIPRHIQWTLLVYSTFFLAHGIFIIWWFILEMPYEEKITTRFLFLGYINMMNYVSTCGLLIISDHQASYVVQLTIDMVLVIMSTGLTIALAMLFTKSVISGNSYECVYRYRARFYKQFCLVSNVSDALVARTWNYLHFIYKKQGGEQFPKLYEHAPKYLKQEHMQSLFGRHFTDHPLFYDLHVDLLSQLQTYIKCNYFMPGSIIVEKGSKNGEFYFIETGKVIAIQSTSDDDPNPLYETLGPGSSFGEVQAFLNLEHTKTYKALSSVDLIALAISDWEYLLEWFPASKQKLLNRVQEHADILKYT